MKLQFHILKIKVGENCNCKTATKYHAALQYIPKILIIHIVNSLTFKTTAALLVSILVVSGCATDNSSRNVPVIRLPETVQYSQDPSIYIVRPGDTLYSIAWNYGLDYRLLAKNNGIGTDFKINPGQELKVTENDTEMVPSSPPKTPKLNSGTSNKKRPLKTKVKVVSQDLKPVKEKILKKTVTNWFWPVNGTVVSRFSSSRGGNKGIDIATTGSQPVRAVADGVVVCSGKGLRGYGNLVIIKHNDDFLTAYAYNQVLRVKEKKRVKVGEIIADTGVNGLFKNRLHLEVRYKGKPVNPLIYLKP
jgi:lipoprotein NlpD